MKSCKFHFCLTPTISKCPPIPIKLGLSQNFNSRSRIFLIGINWTNTGFPIILTTFNPAFSKIFLNSSGVKAWNLCSISKIPVLIKVRSLLKDSFETITCELCLTLLLALLQLF